MQHPSIYLWVSCSAPFSYHTLLRGPCCCCSTEAAPHLSSEEVQAALDVLDTDRSGTIDFPEWVSWWVSKAQQVPQ